MVNLRLCGASCADNCCYSPSGISLFTGVDLRDAKRIHQVTGIDYKDFLRYAWVTPSMKREMQEDLLDFPWNTESSLRLFMMREDHLLILRSPGGKCLFYNAEEGCTIPYSAKNAPNICRIWPYWAAPQAKGEIQVILHEGGGSCPHSSRSVESQGLQEYVEKEGTREMMVASKLSTAGSTLVVRLWQEMQDGAREYVAGIEQFVKEHGIKRR